MRRGAPASLLDAREQRCEAVHRRPRPKDAPRARLAQRLAAAQASAKANDLTVETRQGEAMDLLRELKAEGQRFETVVVDPPALIKRKRDHEKGLEHYAALNRAANRVAVEVADWVG